MFVDNITSGTLPQRRNGTRFYATRNVLLSTVDLLGLINSGSKHFAPEKESESSEHEPHISSFDLPALVNSSGKLRAQSAFHEDFDATFSSADLPYLTATDAKHSQGEAEDSYDPTFDPFDDAEEAEDSHQSPSQKQYCPHRLSVISERTEPLSLPLKRSHRKPSSTSFLVSTHPGFRNMSQQYLGGPLPLGFNQVATRSRPSLASLLIDPFEEETDAVSDTSTDYDSPVLRTRVYNDFESPSEPQNSLKHSRTSAVDTLKAYPVPHWTIPQRRTQPLPQGPARHSTQPSWVTIVSETEQSNADQSEDPNPFKAAQSEEDQWETDDSEDWESERSMTPTSVQQPLSFAPRTPSTTRSLALKTSLLERGLTPTSPPFTGVITPSTSPFVRRIISQGLTSCHTRSKTPISTLESSLQQRACQVASLVGAPEPDRLPLTRPSSFHQRVCAAVQASESRIAPGTTSYAEKSLHREFSPLETLTARLQSLSTRVTGISDLEEQLAHTWGVASTDTVRPVLYEAARYQTAASSPARPSPCMAFLQCAGRAHEMHPVYPKQLFGMGGGVDGERKGLERVFCDVCSKEIERTKWVCRVAECGLECCTECKKGLGAV